jgi:Na+/melibiose symporter-like transporter
MRRIILSNLFIGLGTGATAPINVFFLHDAKGFGVPDVGLLLIFYICPGLIGSPLWARVARAYGKDRTIQLACFAYAAAMAGLLALPRVHAPYPMVDAIPTAIGMFALGFTVSAFQFMFGSMVADVVDEVKLEDGHDATSLLYSMITTTSKLGSTATVLLVFPLLQLIGYDGREGATNTPHAILGLALCYGIAPTLLVLAGAGALFGYRLDAARHSEIRMALEKRDVSAAERGIDLAPATAVEPSRRAQ